jgi:hypothetical protein
MTVEEMLLPNSRKLSHAAGISGVVEKQLQDILGYLVSKHPEFLCN